MTKAEAMRFLTEELCGAVYAEELLSQARWGDEVRVHGLTITCEIRYDSGDNHADVYTIK